MKYGLIGEHLGHSFSKEVHSMLSDYEYEICEISKNELDAFMTARNFTAINITIPYKTDVIPYLYYISEEAKSIGAVNTIVNRDGKLYGYNTDFFGMKSLIERLSLSINGKKVAILGSGGTSKTAIAVAKHLVAREIITVSRAQRDGTITYNEFQKAHTDTEIIINTTPVGMYPDNKSCPIDISKFGKLEGVIDAIYNPIRTNLILDAKERGITAEGGLYMLIAQAVYASEIFLGVKYPNGTIEKIYDDILRKKENIVLIGMPSSGKTTVARIIADLTKKALVDTDELIEENAGTTIPHIFEAEGEIGFRNRESLEIDNVSLQNSIVISTGGGAILKKSNVRSLRQNGHIYFIDRALQDLTPTRDRPLASNKDAMEKLYRERYELYVEAADDTVVSEFDPTATAKKIIGV